MFSTPNRTKHMNMDGFLVHLLNPISLKEFYFTKGKVEGGLTQQEQIKHLRTTCLQNLLKSTHIFSKVPTLDQLERITPPWGFVSTENGIHLNMYTYLENSPEQTYDGGLDLNLISLFISRSCICPIFSVVKTSQLIDMEFDDIENDIEEVESLPSCDDTTKVIQLTDVAERQRNKRNEKEYVRKLFQNARDAAEEWYKKYEISDDESDLEENMDD